MENVYYCGCTEFKYGKRNSKFRTEAASYQRASSTEGGWYMALWMCCLGIQHGHTWWSHPAHTFRAVNDWLEVRRGLASNVGRRVATGISEIQAVTWVHEVRMQLLHSLFGALLQSLIFTVLSDDHSISRKSLSRSVGASATDFHVSFASVLNKSPCQFTNLRTSVYNFKQKHS